MLVTPYVQGQSGLVHSQQQQTVSNVINGGIETSQTTGVDTNGWPNDFEKSNTNQVTIRIGAKGSTPPSGQVWTASNTKISHGLGKTPTGWHIVWQDKVVTIIAGSSKPTDQFIYLTISDDTANTTLIIF
jgi:hypothetical protein